MWKKQTIQALSSESFDMSGCRSLYRCWPTTLQWASQPSLSMSWRCVLVLAPPLLPLRSLPFTAPNLPSPAPLVLLPPALACLAKHTPPILPLFSTGRQDFGLQVVQRVVGACSTLPAKRLKERQPVLRRKWTGLCSSSDCM